MRGRQVKFTGRLSLDGKVVTQQASGEMQKMESGGEVFWRGVIRFPIEARSLANQSEPVQLDCADGFAMLIELEDPQLRNDSPWIISQFQSHGPPLA